jgi:hypothetical protein
LNTEKNRVQVVQLPVLLAKSHVIANKQLSKPWSWISFHDFFMILSCNANINYCSHAILSTSCWIIIIKNQKLLNYHYQFNYNYRSIQLLYNKATFTVFHIYVHKILLSVFSRYDDSPLFNPWHHWHARSFAGLNETIAQSNEFLSEVSS